MCWLFPGSLAVRSSCIVVSEHNFSFNCIIAILAIVKLCGSCGNFNTECEFSEG